jgi:hypothetical protein
MVQAPAGTQAGVRAGTLGAIDGRTDHRSRESQQGRSKVQKDPEPAYNFRLVERVVEYLQTRDASLFPFTIPFDDAREKAFVRDLREGLSDLVDSGSARKTSATGFILSDRRLREIVRIWAAAGGDWPAASDPAALDSPLAAL